MMLRPALPEDVPVIVSLAHVMKCQLAEWSPLYFRPRRGAEELHSGYLEFLVASDEHDTCVLLGRDDEVVGFFHVVPQPAHRWVDDLYVSNPAQWPETSALLAAQVTSPWVTCVSRFDERRAAGLQSAGLRVVSTYWASSVVGHRGDRRFATDAPDGPVPEGPRHTFGGRLFDPRTPGALVVADDDLGYAIGSPGIEPPLYDPGGPTCVVDRVHGEDRRTILDAAMATVADRGDGGMVVVCDSTDAELSDILLEAGFRAEVDLFARP